MRENLDYSAPGREGGGEADGAPGGTPSRRQGAFVRTVYDFADIIRTAVIAIMVAFCFIFRFVGVNGPSMMPTLSDGDWLLVTALNGKPEYGDIIVSTQDNSFHEPIIKRVIATENQMVDINYERGTVIVDGTELDEDAYIAERIEHMRDVDMPVVVPEGKVFVMGDNRNDSADSRSSLVGCIDENYILGRAFLRLFPTSSFGWIGF